MCGRYTLHSSAAEIADHFAIPADRIPDGLGPRYNIAPTQDVPAAGPSPEGQRGLALLRWGLVPHWADDPSDFSSLINARSETVHEKPAFRGAFARRRCLLPADGFYEWRPEGGAKQPYHLRMPGGELFALAGIWERWSEGDAGGNGEDGGGRTVESCAILTTDAAPEIAGLHDRMPVIVPPEAYDRWTDRSITDREPLQDILASPDETPLEYYPVSRRVNSPSHDGPDCIEPLEVDEGGGEAARR